MSRIRSQLDYLMGEQGARPQSAPRRAFEGMVQQQPHYAPQQPPYQPQQAFQQPPAYAHPGAPAPHASAAHANGYSQNAYPQPAQHPAARGADYLQDFSGQAPAPQVRAPQAAVQPHSYAAQSYPSQSHAPQPHAHQAHAHQAHAPQPHAPQYEPPQAQPRAQNHAGSGQQQPAVSHEEMDKLYEGLNQLARKIQSLPKVLNRPDTQNQGEIVVGELRNGFAQAQKEIRRIAEAINSIQQASNVQPGYVEQMQAELGNLHSSMNKLLAKPDPHFDLSGVSRSIETGYSEIVDRLDSWLTNRQTPQIEIPEFPEYPDYSKQFDALNRKVEEVTRAMVSMSVSAGASEDRDYFERLEARLNSLAKSVDDVIASGNSGASSSQLVNQLQLIDRKLDNMSAMEAAGAQLSGGVDGIVTRLDRIQNDMGVLAQSLEAAQEAPAGAVPFDVSSIEEKLGFIRAGIEEIASNGGGDIDSTGPEILATLKDLVQRVETLETRPAETPAIDDSRFASLEEQLREITGHLQSAGTASTDFGPISERLDNLEGQIVASRDIVIDMANQAAARGGNAESGHNTAILSAMMDEIQNLKAMAESAGTASAIAAPAADERIGDLMDSVSAIASRLASFEAKLDARPFAATQPTTAERAPQAAPRYEPQYEAEYETVDAGGPVPAPAAVFDDSPYETATAGAPSAYAHVEAPSIDMSMNDGFGDENSGPGDLPPVDMAEQQGAGDVEDVPLEPGSGMPDLEALVRKAAHRKKGDDGNTGEHENISELMAAARRAAQAATAEAEHLKGIPETNRSGKKSRVAVSGSKFNTRYLLYAGAAAVIAFGAYSFIPKVVSGFLGTNQQVSANQEAVPGAATGQQTIAPVSGSETAEATTAEEQTAVNQVSREIPIGSDTAEEPNETVSGGETEMAQDTAVDDAGADGEMAGQADSGSDIPVATASFPMPPEEVGNEALRSAAAAGDVSALFEVGRRYTDGDQVDRNLGEAAKWYELAAEAGDAPAQYRLGNFYEKGHGVKQDPQVAADWYEKAAAQGNALAMHNLAVLHAMGVLGGEPDMAEAIMWFQKAANLGVKDSQVNLGILYTKGMGVEEDLEEAYKWFAIASRAGDSDASKKRDTVAQAMRPEQLEAARGKAELWKPGELDRDANIATVRPEWKNAAATGSVNVSGKDAIRQVQTLLTKAGYDVGPADGLMGAKTRDAIVSFQKKIGMNADGKVSSELLEALSKTSI
jgi:localization factor PodJL